MHLGDIVKVYLMFAFLCLAALIYAQGGGLDLQSSQCGGHGTCTSCTGATTCGWSIDQSTCLVGTAHGSTDGSSSGNDWIWATGSCPTQCSTHPTCGNCTGYAHCGWSTSRSQCMFGTSGGSTDGSSSGSDWAWQTSGCAPSSPTLVASPTGRGGLTACCPFLGGFALLFVFGAWARNKPTRSKQR